MAEELKKHDWIKIKPAEVEKLVINLHKLGESPAKIGLFLRDKHGIPKAKPLGKKITQILKGAKLEIKSEEAKILGEIESIKKHLENNKHDIPAKRYLTKLLWSLQGLDKKL